MWYSSPKASANWPYHHRRKRPRLRAGGSSGRGINLINITLSQELKLIGFFINICASLFLITKGLFGKGKPSLLDCVTGKKSWSDLWGVRNYEIEDLNNNAFIASAFVIIGSSMQMAADLLDP